MGIIIVIILFALVIGAGIYWGKHTIEKDTMRKELDEDMLDKLHQMRK